VTWCDIQKLGVDSDVARLWGGSAGDWGHKGFSEGRTWIERRKVLYGWLRTKSLPFLYAKMDRTDRLGGAPSPSR
jgi:hypothetical protein